LSGRACFYADEICARVRGPTDQPTDRPSDRPTDRPTDRRMNGRTDRLSPSPSLLLQLPLVVIIFSVGLSSLFPRLLVSPRARGRLCLLRGVTERNLPLPPPSLPPSLSLGLAFVFALPPVLSVLPRLVRNESCSIGVDSSTSRSRIYRVFCSPPPPPPPAPLFRFLTLSGCSLSLFPSAGVCHPSFPRLAFSLSPDPFVTRCYPAHSRGSFTSSASFLFLPSALDCRGCASRSDDGQE